MRRVTRREFLDQSTRTVAGAAALAAGVDAAAQAAPTVLRRPVSPNEKIHVALVGCGGMGGSDLRDFLRVDEVECLAVCDVDETHAAGGVQTVEERRGKKPDVYKDFRQVMDRKDIDAVIVATPDHWHALPMIHACQSGKDVYVEKPLATSIGEGRVMVDVARKHGRVVQVGTQQRSAGHFRDAVEFVRSGKLGKIRAARAWAFLDWKGGIGNPPDGTPPETVDYDFWQGPAQMRPFNPARFHFTFRWFWRYSGGLMTDWGAHMLDVVMWAMNQEPLGAMAIGGKYGYPDDIMETPDTQQSIVKFPTFSLTWEHMIGAGLGPWQREHGVEFHGQNGVLVVDRGGWEVHPETDKVNRPERIKRMEAVPRQPASQDYHFAHVQNFLECMQSRERPVADVELGHKSVVACHLGNIGVRLQRYVPWDADNEIIPGDPEAQALVTYPYRKPWELPKI